VLVVAVDRAVEAGEVAAAMRTLRARVDARDPGTLARAGAGTPRDFYDRFLRLNAVVAWTEDAPGPERAVGWQDPSARITLDRRALAAVVGALNGPPAG
jgi:hypothetical protein